MLTYIEGEYRRQANRMEGMDGDLYNPLTMIFLEQSMEGLAALILTPTFRRKWRQKRLALLNACATDFFKTKHHSPRAPDHERERSGHLGGKRPSQKAAPRKS
jgi:hypothetical protein